MSLFGILCARLKINNYEERFCVQDKRYGGSERGEESTMSGVSAVCKYIVLVLAVLAGAVALCNTVTNDVVVATSDAELRISDRGLGLGLEVVGGGAAEVKLEARPGWRFRDGSTSVTLNKAAGSSAKSPAVVGEGQGAENYVPGVDVNDDESGGDENDEGSVDHEKPVLSLTATAPKVVAYSVLDGGTNVSITLSATVTTKGKHRKLDANGNVVKEEEFSPKCYVWKMTGAATGEAETDSPSHAFTVNLTKGKGQKLSFSVVGKICSICDGDVESDEAKDSVEIDVYELSISRPDYLGLDRTDAGRQGHVVKTATLSSDPSLPSSSSVEWTECGICEFVGAKNQRSVSYQNKDSDTASGEYLAERLAASVKLAGMDSSVVCATNFTVVKVDVAVAEVAEGTEETAGPIMQYIRKNMPVQEARKWRKSLSISCVPKELPDAETISISHVGDLYERRGQKLVRAQSSYPYNVVSAKNYFLCGYTERSKTSCDKHISVEHANLASKATDKVNYSVATMSFTVFVEQPFPHQRIAIVVVPVGINKTKFVPGHVWWRFYSSLTDGIDNGLASVLGEPVGFYPVKDLSEAQLSSEGTLRMPDIAHKANVKHTWLISADGLCKGLAQTREMISNPPKYNAMLFNCAGAAVAVGRSAGVKVPSTKGTKFFNVNTKETKPLGFGLLNAGDMGEDLRELNRRDRK